MTDKKYKNILREILEEKIPNTKRRDFLIQNERQVQTQWNDAKAFEFDRPEDIAKPKFMATFPYPYMNGRLHLGHVFTISKADFAVFYERLKGKHALFPFAFHCTGMPIKASADKLRNELAIYGPGGPPPPSEEELESQRNEIKESLIEVLDGKKAPVKAPAKAPAKGKQSEASPKDDPSAFHSQKSKAAAKGGAAKTQWDIMRSLGLTDDEIVQFTDPLKWLHYFPPHCIEDLKRFGAGVDWRRSFITTEVNAFYDSFVRWQFETLRDLGKIKFGKRYSIYSPLDGQPCLDHDRSSGENVLPQDYTLIKMQVVSKIPNFDYSLLSDLRSLIQSHLDNNNINNNINNNNNNNEENNSSNNNNINNNINLSENENIDDINGVRIYLVPATLRPETMYGQTNCWIKPDGEYGAFLISPHDVFICSDRAARNMAYQELSAVSNKVIKLATIKGSDLIGLKLKAPLSHYPIVYTLPMMTISLNKGTGIVTSVPSDSPDDFAALRDLKNKPALREKFAIRDHWVMEYEAVPIIGTSMGDMIAPTLVESLKIKSQNDEKLLAEAKEKAYLLGYYEGILLVGDFKGDKVEVVKEKIKGQLIDRGLAVAYSEPEKPVVSKSGDDCVVALVDQWFLVYGESTWKSLALSALKEIKTYHEETRHMFEKTLGWLNQWACSRSFGLGSKFPWDSQYLIESLSDSTIYMAYYTIAHLLQKDINGSEIGCLQISANDFTRETWDYIFLGKEYVKEKISIDENKLRTLRDEFLFWYPLDLRVSGKDLVPNHLTFSIYNHTAIFPPQHWLRGIRANGHLLLNNMKMSKSTGNFLTLYDALDLFGADATRFALADAGDTLEDANFSSSAANKAVLSLYNSLQWVTDTLLHIDHFPLRSVAPRNFSDQFADQSIDNNNNNNQLNQLSNQSNQSSNQSAEKSSEKSSDQSINSNQSSDRSADQSINHNQSSDQSIHIIPSHSDPSLSEFIHLADLTFDSQMNAAIASADIAYQKLNYRDALLHSFFELRNARDDYRLRVGSDLMNRSLLLKFIEVQSLLMTPLTPHWSEKIWSLLGKEGMIVHAKWPEGGKVDEKLLMINTNLNNMIEDFRKKIASSKVKITNGVISVATKYPNWHVATVHLLQSLSLEGNLTVQTATEKIKSDVALKKFANLAMPLSRDIIEKWTKGENAFDVSLPYDEKQLLIDNLSFLERTLEIKLSIADEENPGAAKNSATPLHPVLSFPKSQ